MGEQILIGDLARRTGLSTKTIRYYEEAGILPPPARLPNGYRVYGEGDVVRLQFIRRARALDFALDDIGEILAFRDRGEAPCLYVLRTIDRKIDEVEQRIADLEQLRRDLVELRQAAQGLPVDDVEGKECVCHLIQNREMQNL